MREAFDGNAWTYHLVNIGIHLASAALVWRLAARLDARLVVRQVATAVFALYPGSFEAVTWIASVNSAALPCAIGSWLAFLNATEREGLRRDWLAWSVALLTLGLCFRETAVALTPGMVLWYALVQRRGQLREWRTWAVFAPFLALALLYYLLRTRLLTHPVSNPDIYGIDRDFVDRWWYYIKNALLPFRDPVSGWKVSAQRASGIVLLGITMAALVRRNWKLSALLLGFILSVTPAAANLLGVGARYLYFSTPLLAIAAGLLAARGYELVREMSRARVPLLAGAAMATLLALAAFSTGSRLQNWDSAGPQTQQQWVDSLRAAYPTLPAGGTLYCANVPLALAIFDAANLEPVVQWFYPQVAHAVLVGMPEAPPLGPNDRYFDAASSVTPR